MHDKCDIAVPFRYFFCTLQVPFTQVHAACKVYMYCTCSLAAPPPHPALLPAHEQLLQRPVDFVVPPEGAADGPGVHIQGLPQVDTGTQQPIACMQQLVHLDLRGAKRKTASATEEV